MDLHLQKSKVKSQKSKATITGSKSETNRLLLLQALYPNISIENTSISDDSEVMSRALNSQLTTHNSQLIDVHHAGTAMRFLTAYFAQKENCEIILTGSSRMKERPIKVLVDALQQLGADIEYLENTGFPPIKIKGKKLTQNKVSLPANVSSQYISALLLIAPKLENGLILTLEGDITSMPYIKMTLEILHEIGIKTSFLGNKITVCHAELVSASQFTIESDWSSASYWYSIVALSEIGFQVTLSSYKENSLQGDSALVNIYQDFGVETVFNYNNSITISKERIHNSQLTTHNSQLNNSPDIAQTIAVTCFGLGIACDLYGLHTLKIKETDRLEALKTELSKLGAQVCVTNNSLHLEASTKFLENQKINTYQDHRMAMAFAPMALKVPIIIQEAEVVSKSYPTFWHDLKNFGFEITSV
ncbi:3-phosphoshikimate 1-carboxyvinyltransferase [Flavobacterium croceum DSM 17960]|uniref:3-phosphoshikimate 1-carboxyvinyltransferase n=1 Tax=Flavobacterium croceum DSM 17960 TaxID=1121886 RepID=A0A2S4NAT6_9FLAO|nr:3-phosphoshikimate 1-carboxyvinyltransferase [Flavobacterium croceum]POS02563.1 3-phosphoshikimate 1-carboxyvinyltransferase [Flavobacterium croceum DSM 17960]